MLLYPGLADLKFVFKSFRVSKFWKKKLQFSVDSNGMKKRILKVPLNSYLSFSLFSSLYFLYFKIRKKKKLFRHNKEK